MHAFGHGVTCFSCSSCFGHTWLAWVNASIQALERNLMSGSTISRLIEARVALVTDKSSVLKLLNIVKV